MDLAPCMPKPKARSISEGSRPWRESITWANPAKWPVRGKGVGKPSRLFRSLWNGVRDLFMEAFSFCASIRRMSSELNTAKKQVKEARKVMGRKLENRFLDLCSAVEKIITHLEKSERAKKPGDGQIITVNET